MAGRMILGKPGEQTSSSQCYYRGSKRHLPRENTAERPADCSKQVSGVATCSMRMVSTSRPVSFYEGSSRGANCTVGLVVLRWPPSSSAAPCSA